MLTRLITTRDIDIDHAVESAVLDEASSRLQE
jgi:hypothetical protein